jgi:hypothetical protein
MNRSFEEMGMAKGYGFKRLLFCAPANTLVVQTQPIQGWRPDRLYIRPASGEQYQAIGSPAELVSQEDPAVSSVDPLLAYNTLRHSFRADEDGNELHGANWEAIRVIDLTSGAEIRVVDRDRVHFPDPEIYIWSLQVLAFAQASETLHVVVGFSRNQTFPISHYIAELHLPTGLVRPLTNLPATFL